MQIQKNRWEDINIIKSQNQKVLRKKIEDIEKNNNIYFILNNIYNEY